METIKPLDDVLRGAEAMTSALRLCAADQVRLAEPGLAPPAPAPALVRAFERLAVLVLS